MIYIEQVGEITDEIEMAFTLLIPQLSPHCNIPCGEDLQKLVALPGNYLFIARNTQIVGTLTLVVIHTPSGKKAWIEDVVVDTSARGQKIGELLVRHAVSFAAELGVTSINLTSRPDRVAANKLYRSIGFELRETNVYRLDTNKYTLPDLFPDGE
ncbi:GNAT family N-acetyltransferase [Dysgonomonas sp. Marseille-P4677]|uniref:GNAT family N-acetyltransferase n=1 Tax=Dysgonomonas sp. Marseille-P4677 TaxID=2364790 RepID=UPI0019148121|nr:GNAT family N-acetyltransferase [Dysgonomonas sp. Marseille-P4677]MBK5721868.1 GNAT family N-acetyltransferase [Dysgonomonas sp. Marseille-P4677]